MYTLYTDKPETFECKISLQGAKLKDSRARLVVESDDINLIFYGQIDESGKCIVPIKKLKNILNENIIGKIKLEVIAEDTFFEPWKDEFEVKTDKKVVVESVKNTKNSITEKSVKITGIKSTNKNIQKITEDFLKVLKTSKINLINLKEHQNTLKLLSNIFVKKYSLDSKEIPQLINGVLKNLSEIN